MNELIYSTHTQPATQTPGWAGGVGCGGKRDSKGGGDEGQKERRGSCVVFCGRFRYRKGFMGVSKGVKGCVCAAGWGRGVGRQQPFVRATQKSWMIFFLLFCIMSFFFSFCLAQTWKEGFSAWEGEV